MNNYIKCDFDNKVKFKTKLKFNYKEYKVIISRDNNWYFTITNNGTNILNNKTIEYYNLEDCINGAKRYIDYKIKEEKNDNLNNKMKQDFIKQNIKYYKKLLKNYSRGFNHYEIELIEVFIDILKVLQEE